MKSSSFLLSFIIIAVLQTSCNSYSEDKQSNGIATSNSGTILNASLQTASDKKTEAIAQADESMVEINGIMLTDLEIRELKITYGAEPKAGKYWYDSKSGLYGVMGYQAFGFMKPGHHFGTLKRNASSGDTQVFVNGRELPQSEWLVWSQLIGGIIAPGSYWLDGSGNAGYEGNSIPTVNLYIAARQNTYHGGSGGDNFWSSRFSAGNSNADNSQGYVSVPGYGPVGYGF